MRIAVGQMNPRVGDLEQNSARIRAWLDECEDQGVDLLVLPELALTGYPPKDLLRYPSFVQANLKALESLAATTKRTTVVVGYVEPNDGEGAPYYNSAAVLAEGKMVGNYRKQLLPNYDIFDERRYFTPGTGEGGVIEVAGKKIGLSICEDAWNVPGGTPWKYDRQPLDQWKGVDFLLNLSASPFCLGRPEERGQVFEKASAHLGAPILVCNQAGANDELLFDGASFWVEPEGGVVPLGNAFEESVSVFSPDPFQIVGGLVPWPATPEAWLELALVTGIRDYVHKSRLRSVCLGLSGGVDSSVVAALAQRALGSENVAAISLPTRFTSDASREDAQILAERLGVEFHECSVDDLFSSYEKNWKKWFAKEPGPLTLENLQPRIRMTVLMGHANECGHLLLNTSNKSEIATGYSTLYGDSAGALAVLGDLTKGQVYALARHLNRQGEVIPQRVLDRPPTAELRNDQTDEDSLPPYPVLDTLVEEVVVASRHPEEMEGSVEQRWQSLFQQLLGRSEYKRYQLPPVLRVSSLAFGVGRRMPLASKSWPNS